MCIGVTQLDVYLVSRRERKKIRNLYTADDFSAAEGKCGLCQVSSAGLVSMDCMHRAHVALVLGVDALARTFRRTLRKLTPFSHSDSFDKIPALRLADTTGDIVFSLRLRK